MPEITGEAPRRPKRIWRIDLDGHFFGPGWDPFVPHPRKDPPSFEDRVKAHVVPIEAARPGDLQVTVDDSADAEWRWANAWAAVQVPGVLRNEEQERRAIAILGRDAPEPISLDPLGDELASVESVLLSRRARATKRLPNVRELLVRNADAPPELWALLPRLEKLVVFGGELPPLERLPGGLRTLVLIGYDRVSDGWSDGLARFADLESLVLAPGYGSSFSLAPVAELGGLRRLVVDGGKHHAKLGALERLEEATFRTGVELTRLPGLKPFRRCRALRVLEAGVRDLDGIEALASLEVLKLGGRRLPADLSPLARAPALTELRLRTGEADRAFDDLADVTGLRTLHLDTGSISRAGELRDLRFLRRMARLEKLDCNAHVRDGDLEPLRGKPLRFARLVGAFSKRDVERLRAEHPQARVEVVVAGAQAAFLEPERAESNGETSWCVAEDLTNQLGRFSNDGVEKLVRRTVKERAPELLSRLEFDSEAGQFCVRAVDERSIREVVAIVRALIAERAREASPPQRG